jgi:hypothetical protein
MNTLMIDYHDFHETNSLYRVMIYNFEKDLEFCKHLLTGKKLKSEEKETAARLLVNIWNEAQLTKNPDKIADLQARLRQVSGYISMCNQFNQEGI